MYIYRYIVCRCLEKPIETTPKKHIPLPPNEQQRFAVHSPSTSPKLYVGRVIQPFKMSIPMDTAPQPELAPPSAPPTATAAAPSAAPPATAATAVAAPAAPAPAGNGNGNGNGSGSAAAAVAAAADGATASATTTTTSATSAVGGSKPIQAYAKLQGENFVYYVQTLSVTLGRRVAGSGDDVDVDLGSGRTISRRHARIEYDFTLRQFVLLPLSKNGVHVNGVLYRVNDRVPLETKCVLERGERRKRLMREASQLVLSWAGSGSRAVAAAAGEGGAGLGRGADAQGAVQRARARGLGLAEHPKRAQLCVSRSCSKQPSLRRSGLSCMGMRCGVLS